MLQKYSKGVNCVVLCIDSANFVDKVRENAEVLFEVCAFRIILIIIYMPNQNEIIAAVCKYSSSGIIQLFSFSFKFL